MLADFIAANRDQIMTRYRAKASFTSLRIPLDAGSECAALAFLDKLSSMLRLGPNTDSGDGSGVHHLANDVLEDPSVALRIAQYGDLGESVAELALEMKSPVNVTECATLDRTIDEATARAVTESISERRQTAHGAVRGGSERLHVFRSEVRELIQTAILSFDALRTGRVALDGSTGRLLIGSLIELRSLIDRVESGGDGI